jgi:small GTP-binding protein
MISLLGGVFRGLTALEEKKVLLVGLDGSGKSTYVNQLKLQLNKPHAARECIKPTMGLNVFSFELEKKKFTVWDIAGGRNYRKVWHSYIEEADALVFVVDGAALERLEEVREALRALLADPRTAGKTLQCFLNKSVAASDQDRDGFSVLPFSDMIREEAKACSLRLFIDELCSVATVDPKKLVSICMT